MQDINVVYSEILTNDKFSNMTNKLCNKSIT